MTHFNLNTISRCSEFRHQFHVLLKILLVLMISFESFKISTDFFCRRFFSSKTGFFRFFFLVRNQSKNNFLQFPLQVFTRPVCLVRNANRIKRLRVTYLRARKSVFYQKEKIQKWLFALLFNYFWNRITASHCTSFYQSQPLSCPVCCREPNFRNASNFFNDPFVYSILPNINPIK
jgi:hypothetical protein